jgi:toxin ParE1/3/4
MPGKRRHYTLVPLARADLEGIWRYSFETWSITQADTYHERLVRAFQALVVGTKTGRPIDHIRQGYYKFPVGSHLIFYRESTSGIEIVRILHQRMDIAKHLQGI